MTTLRLKKTTKADAPEASVIKSGQQSNSQTASPQSDPLIKLDLPQDQINIINQYQKFYRRPNSPEPLTFYSTEPKW